MGVELVQRGDAGGVATLVLNRAERRNALSSGLLDALLSRLDEVEADRDVRAVVLTGAGPVFCAGGDLGGGLGGGGGVLAGHLDRQRFGDALLRPRTMSKPVIAAVQGDALGGGLGLALSCDLVVADPAARLGTPEIHVGLFPYVILAVLQRDVPRKPLMDLVMGGRKVSAERALALHMINRVAAPGAALAEAQALASELAGRSPAVLALGKAAFYRASELPFEEALRALGDQLTLNLLTEDALEGITAFREKRAPSWKGR